MATLGLDSIKGHLAKTFQIEIANLKHLAELLVGDDTVDSAFGLFGCDLELTSDTGADVDDRGLFGLSAFDKTSDCYHWRNNANQVLQKLRVVTFDQVDDCRAVSGYQGKAGVLLDLATVTVA